MKLSYLLKMANILHTVMILRYLTLTLKLNSELFTFNLNEKQTISPLPGKYS